MKAYSLIDDFIDTAEERALMAAIAGAPALYWELLDTLPTEAFAAEPEAWGALAAAIEAERPAAVPVEWSASSDPQASGRRLADLYQRRLLAGAQERLAARLHDPETPAAMLASLLEEEAAGVQAAIRETAAGRLLWASDLLSDVLRDAETRNLKRLETGKPVLERVAKPPTIGLHSSPVRWGAYPASANCGATRSAKSRSWRSRSSRSSDSNAQSAYSRPARRYRSRCSATASGFPANGAGIHGVVDRTAAGSSGRARRK